MTANRLLAISNVQYACDPAGSRVAITNGAVVTRFVINPSANLPRCSCGSGPA